MPELPDVEGFRATLAGVRDDPDGSCPRCGTPLSHGKVGGRSTLWCPHCQPAPGRALPGRRGRPGWWRASGGLVAEDPGGGDDQDDAEQHLENLVRGDPHQ
jgi:hypothetical protein